VADLSVEGSLKSLVGGKSSISNLRSLEWLLEKQFSYISMINALSRTLAYILDPCKLGLRVSYFGIR